MTPTSAPLDPDALDRAVGTLLGTAVGDALGAGYEFGTARLDGQARMIGGGLGGFAPGEFTDDTTMAVCIAEVAATGADLTTPAAQAAVGERFLDWARSGPPDIGIATAAVLGRGRTGAELPAVALAHHRASGRSGGNGALMRTAPVALATLGDDTRLAAAARAVAELTHAEDVAAESCVLWCAAVDRAVRTGRPAGPADGLALLPEARRGWWADRIGEAEDAAAAGDLGRFRPNGYTVTALQAAWGAICSIPVGDADPVTTGLQAAIAIGDDTDTVAAIAGALLGARAGATAIPAAWLAVVHGPIPGRPGTRLDATDLRRLAVAIVTPRS